MPDAVEVLGDEHRDGALAPSSSPMSIGWRGVKEIL